MSSPVRRKAGRPRSTANRRLYLGDTSGLRAPGSGPYALPPGTEGAVECPQCQTWVTTVQGGTRPRSHSYGGHRVNVRAGHPACEGSGCLNRSATDTELRLGLPVRSEGQARAERLVTRAMIARAIEVERWQVDQWFDASTASPQPVALLDRSSQGSAQPFLYDAAESIVWARECKAWAS